MRRFNAPLSFLVCALGALTVLGGLTGCEPLGELPKGTCGNGVVDSDLGEECDGHATAGAKCGTKGPESCRFVCTGTGAMAGPTPGPGPAPAESTDAVCPEGFGCGADGICRTGAGGFSLVGGTLEGDTYALSLADFDADGRQDVLVAGAEELRIHFFDPGNVLGGTLSVKGRSEVPISKHIVPPVTGQLTEGDSNIDIVSHTGSSVAVLRGGNDRTLAAAQYPFTQLPAGQRLRLTLMEADIDKPGHEVIALVKPAEHEKTLILPADVVDLPVSSFPDFSDMMLGSADQIVGDIPSGKFIAGSSCDQFVLAYGGDNKVVVVSPCAPPIDPLFKYNVELYPVKLPAGHTVRQGAHVADMNIDGKLDLVVGAVQECDVGSCCVVDVAYGDGMGGFSSPTAVVNEAGALAGYPYRKKKVDNKDIDYACQPYSPDSPPSRTVPIAVGEINGDGVPDFVDHSGIVLSEIDNNTVKYLRAAEDEIESIFDIDPSSPWTHAIIADVNADTHPDVVAGSALSPGLDVFYGTIFKVVFNRQSITTSKPTSHLASGYFDGDLAQDIVFAESNSSAATESTMSVVFGNILAPLGVPVKLADTGKIEQIVTGILFSTALESVDAMEEIAAVTIDGSNTTNTLLFSGSVYRQLVSPYRILQGDGTPPNTDVLTSFGLTVGHFVTGEPDEPVHADIAAVAVALPKENPNGPPMPMKDERLSGIVLLKSTGEASLPTSMATPAPIVSDALEHVLLEGGGIINPAICAINLETEEEEPERLDEIALFLPEVLALDKPARLVWFVAKSEGGVWKVEDKGVIAEKIRFPQKPPKTVVADIDANGYSDLAFLYLDDAQVPHVDVIWNDGAGTFGAAISHVVSEPLEGDLLPADFTLVNLDVDRALEIALATTGGVYVADIARTEPALVGPKPVTMSGYTAAGSLIEAGDITGDGVVDLAVGTSLGVQVFEGTPKVR